MNNFIAIKNNSLSKSDIMKELKYVFYKQREYVNIVEHEVRKGKEGKEYFEKLAKVYNYFVYEQKRKIISMIKTVFELNNIKSSLSSIENIEFDILVSSWINQEDKREYEKLERHYEDLIEKNNKKWMTCMNKYEKVFHKNIETMFAAPAYRFFLPNYEKIGDDLLEEMDRINDASDPIFKERDSVLGKYENYSIYIEALHKLNKDIDELYNKSFNFLWSKIKELSFDELMQIKYSIEY